MCICTNLYMCICLCIYIYMYTYTYTYISATGPCGPSAWRAVQKIAIFPSVPEEYRAPPPPLPGFTGMNRVSGFLMIFWLRLGTIILSILVPTWLQLGSQLGLKIDQKSIQEPSKIHLNLHLVFDRFLDRFLIDFWSIFDPPNRSKIHHKSTNKSSQQHNNQNFKNI